MHLLASKRNVGNNDVMIISRVRAQIDVILNLSVRGNVSKSICVQKPELHLFAFIHPLLLFFLSSASAIRRRVCTCIAHLHHDHIESSSLFDDIPLIFGGYYSAFAAHDVSTFPAMMPALEKRKFSITHKTVSCCRIGFPLLVLLM